MRGDAIISMGDRQISPQNDLLGALRRDVANRMVSVSELRNGNEVSVYYFPRNVQTFG